jgi:simple sugar transport system ATP-binding protein
MVHQHFMLVPKLTVVENIALGLPSNREPFTNLMAAEERIREISSQYRLTVDPRAKVWQLSVGEQQRVEIIKVIYRGTKLLILDEPTAVLTPQEARELFITLRVLIEQGHSVIFISHKLDEVLEISRRVMVMRLGKVVGTVETAKTNAQELVRMMVGHDIMSRSGKKQLNQGNVVLDVKDLEVSDDRNLLAVRGISFQVHQGEIYGIAGVDGNGQRELVEAITGMRRIQRGKVLFNGKDISCSSPNEILELGLGHIPEDRQKTALVLRFTIQENAILINHRMPPFSRYGILKPEIIRNFTADLIKTFDVRGGGPELSVGALSGGNQQKLVLGREISRNPRLLVAAQPTRGLDVGATAFVHSQLLHQRDEGVAILLISTESEELFALSDKLAVIYKGAFLGQFLPQEASLEEVGLMMAGKKTAEKA